jgi:hypothetical protein
VYLDSSRPVGRRLAIAASFSFRVIDATLPDARPHKMGSGPYSDAGGDSRLARRFRSVADQAQSAGLLVMGSAIAGHPSHVERPARREVSRRRFVLARLDALVFALGTRFGSGHAATPRATRQSALTVGALAQRPKRPHLKNGERTRRQHDHSHSERHRTTFGFTLLELAVHGQLSHPGS